MIGPAEASGGVSRYQLKITPVGSKPPIWRQVFVPVLIRLDRLHNVIQTTMGWFDCHLHQYVANHYTYGTTDPEFGREILSERRHTQQDIASHTGSKFVYQYDFGDNWEHKIVAENILPPAATVRYPICLAGKNACPPKDFGGIHSYYEFLEALQNPNHEEHESMKSWIGGAWDPTAFRPQCNQYKTPFTQFTENEAAHIPRCGCRARPVPILPVYNGMKRNPTPSETVIKMTRSLIRAKARTACRRSSSD